MDYKLLMIFVLLMVNVFTAIGYFQINSRLDNEKLLFEKQYELWQSQNEIDHLQNNILRELINQSLNDLKQEG